MPGCTHEAVRPAGRINHHARTPPLQVFSAPHIATMSSFLFGVQFEPIYYRIEPNNSIASNVRFHHPVLGTGWLSAAGACLIGAAARGVCCQNCPPFGIPGNNDTLAVCRHAVDEVR